MENESPLFRTTPPDFRPSDVTVRPDERRSRDELMEHHRHLGIGAARFGRAPGQRRLTVLGVWRNPGTGLYVPPSKSVTFRVLESADPTEIEAALRHRSVPRLRLGAALTAGGRHIRGANRFGDGRHETATLVARDTGLPVACHGFDDEGGERAAVRAVLEEIALAGRVITVDVLHTTGDTARGGVETRGADRPMTVKANAEERRPAPSTGSGRRPEASNRSPLGRVGARSILPKGASAKIPG